MDNDDQILIHRRYMNYNVSTVADGGCYTSCNIGNLVVHPMVSYRRMGWSPMVAVDVSVMNSVGGCPDR